MCFLSGLLQKWLHQRSWVFLLAWVFLLEGPDPYLGRTLVVV
jgi:hypothetical protein